METQTRKQIERVLVADDKLEIRTALASALKTKGLESELAETPERAVNMARQRGYGIIITDLDFTDNGGHEYLREGNGEGYEVLEQTRGLPVKRILYTGRTYFDVACKAYSRGADYVVLNKDQSRLLEIVDEIQNEVMNKPTSRSLIESSVATDSKISQPMKGGLN